MDAQRPSPISSLILITLIFFLLSSGGQDPTLQLRLREALRARSMDLNEYTAYLNASESNFTLTYPPPASIRPLLDQILPFNPLPSSTYSYHNNITGFLRSPAISYNLSSIPETLPWAEEGRQFIAEVNTTEAQALKGDWSWDWEKKGKVALNVKEEAGVAGMTFIHGQLDITSSSDLTASYQLEGVHFPLNGTVYALLSPLGKFVDIRQLPPLLPEDTRNATSWAVQKELQRRLIQLAGRLNSPQIEPMPPMQPTACPMALYLRLAPSDIPLEAMLDLERETREPTGASTFPLPKIRGRAVLVSWRCGVVVVLDDVGGLKADRFWRKATTYASLASLIYLFLLIVLVRQMEHTRTPSSISKLSRWTFALQAVGDAYSFVCHLTIGIVSDNRASLTLIAPGFLAATLFLVFEVRYATLIHRIQAPEDDVVDNIPTPGLMAAPQPTPAPEAQPAQTESPAEEETAPLAPAVTVTAPPPPPPSPTAITPLFGPSLLRRVLNSITDPESKFWALLLLSFIFLVQATLSPSLVLFAIGALYSFWVPQIARNARRGTRKALSWRYVMCTSIARLSFVMYVFACPENVLFAEPTEWVWIVVAWVTFQIMMLYGQEIFGPAFFLPRSWVTTQIYDYHPPLSAPDTEAPEKSLGDCSICMEPILLSADGSGGTNAERGGALLASVGVRRPYALAPCHHIFHTTCLERWLAIKNICPQCRRPLPPL